ncbi:aromatic ring-hydroxylating oxygenase subunit alpha [Novosphingobium taihuense]|uniref:Phenylpropionate dioxygenase-like ring-hydroxylating dioxygenase large terminal subunit n=1 Tax=Novosphingobium taihuense TaxID=260085 RepID=A0A7W7AEY6_9SPHN|nr:aromatic ring-hydroxylating dioxygenase subunit alpha [Novosphingobium taihuense]MBB4615808.1 phenylpropionate dioxygenase-like ring-hydroxylating dioxygenase large terminal subunit [Novosphingobium taihuense]TWH79202.1 phenylpropionate dioxygenase-like ring-hydroxylating dioxygenase large terminal subunit [Novosphingobium taihuense]
MAFPDAVTDAWHMVALASDIRPGAVRKVMLCNTPIALFRSASGLGALIDRCPHRNYPLSRGRVENGALTCPYHGWRFAMDGTCVEVPGCPAAALPQSKLAAQALRVIERHGAVFVTLNGSAPDEPDLPPDVGNPDLDHFWWQHGTWQGRAFDAIENVMDPFHTGHLHHGFIRRRDRRLPVKLVVSSHGDSIEMAIEQDAPDLGIMSRFLERDRQRSISRYYPPTIVQARWQGRAGLTLCVTAIFTPATDGSFTPFARFSTRKGLAPGWLKQAAIRLFLAPVVAQDRKALGLQHAVMTHFGHPQFAEGPGDILGSRLHRLWSGHRLSPGVDDGVMAEL